MVGDAFRSGQVGGCTGDLQVFPVFIDQCCRFLKGLLVQSCPVEPGFDFKVNARLHLQPAGGGQGFPENRGFKDEEADACWK